jgi:hypothetical protein
VTIERRVIMEGVEARGVSHDDLISWSAAAAMRSERSQIDSTRGSPVEDIPGLSVPQGVVCKRRSTGQLPNRDSRPSNT